MKSAKEMMKFTSFLQKKNFKNKLQLLFSQNTIIFLSQTMLLSILSTSKSISQRKCEQFKRFVNFKSRRIFLSFNCRKKEKKTSEKYFTTKKSKLTFCSSSVRAGTLPSDLMRLFLVAFFGIMLTGIWWGWKRRDEKWAEKN